MNDWEEVDRHLGPAGPDASESFATPGGTAASDEAARYSVPTPIQAQDSPAPSGVLESPGSPAPVVLPAVAAPPPVEEDEWAGEWAPEDEFSPRYCPRCHRKIPRIVSERQEMCNACLAAQGMVPERLPVTAPFEAPGAVIVHCPMCAGVDVQREWRNDWVSTAVDIVSDAAALGTMLLGSLQPGMRRGVDWNRDIGQVKVMRHRCLSCGYKWVE